MSQHVAHFRMELEDDSENPIGYQRSGQTQKWVFVLLRLIKTDASPAGPARLGVIAIALAALCGCAPDYSPNVYAANAVQQANKVEPGVVVGFRQVEISANGTVGAVTGGAVGGILGSQTPGSSFNSALGAVGGSVVGGVVGTGIEHVTADTTGWEYIVRKPNGDLLSLTQREPQPIPLGQKVLVITGAQARIIADYSVPPDPKPASDAAANKDKADKPKVEAKKPPEPDVTAPTPIEPTASVLPADPTAPPIPSVQSTPLPTPLVPNPPPAETPAPSATDPSAPTDKPN